MDKWNYLSFNKGHSDNKAPAGAPTWAPAWAPMVDWNLDSATEATHLVK